MRTRAAVVAALLSLPCLLSAQGGVRLPRAGGGRVGPPTAAPLPPEVEPVARALAARRSRWSAEGYTVVSNVFVPTTNGGTSTFTSLGVGSRADYRYADHLSATIDLTYSPVGGTGTTETAEIGTRFRPLASDQIIRPFLDVRAVYMHMHDTYAIPGNTDFLGGPGQQLTELGRYSRGSGGIVGTGFEYAVTNSLAFTSEVAALRDRLSTYRLTGAPTVPSSGPRYWVTSYRLTIGLRYNSVSSLHSQQNPRS